MWPTLRTLWYSNFEPLPRLGVSKCQKSWNDLPSPSGPTLANSSHWPQWTTHFSALGSTGWGYKKTIFFKSLWSFLLHEIRFTAPSRPSMLNPALWRSVKGEKNSWMTSLEVSRRTRPEGPQLSFKMITWAACWNNLQPMQEKHWFSQKVSRKKQYI